MKDDKQWIKYHRNRKLNTSISIETAQTSIKHDNNELQGVMKIKPYCTKSSQNQLASSVRKTDCADASEMQKLLGKETQIDWVSTQNVKRKVT